MRWGGGNDREAADLRATALGAPRLPQARKRERRVVPECNEVRLFGLPLAPPFIEAISGHEAAAAQEGIFEGRFSPPFRRGH